MASGGGIGSRPEIFLAFFPAVAVGLLVDQHASEIVATLSVLAVLGAAAIIGELKRRS